MTEPLAREALRLEWTAGDIIAGLVIGLTMFLLTVAMIKE
jgi:hypothetical protein